MKRILFEVLVIGAIVSFMAFVALLEPKKLIKSLVPKGKPPTFMAPVDPDPSKLPFIVKLYDRATGHFFCSGSVLNKNYVLTAAHCVGMRDPAEQDIEVRSITGIPIKTYAKLFRAQGQSDLALIVGDFSRFNQRFVETNPTYVIASFQQHKLVACGFPYGGQIYCNEMFYLDLYATFMAARGSLYPGMSGGPVVDIETGAIVGVNSAAGMGYVLLAPTIELLAMFELDVQK